MIQTIHKKRLLFSLYAFLTVIAGLLSRSSLVPQHTFIGQYSGDTLYALFVTLGFCILFWGRSFIQLFSISMLFSVTIELLQLYHASWIDKLRSFRIGGLILGFGFKWSDLVCYSCGTMIGCVIYLFQSRKLPGEG